MSRSRCVEKSLLWLVTVTIAMEAIMNERSMTDPPIDDFEDEASAWSPLSTAEWVELMDYLPMLGQFQKKAIDAGVSPTGALYSAAATVGLGLPFRNINGLFDEDLFDPSLNKTQNVSRVESYFGNDPMPITSYVVMLGEPGTGKTRAATYASPSTNVTLVNAPTSGQALAQSVLNSARRVQRFEDEKLGTVSTEKPKRGNAGSVGYELTTPNFLIKFDEATVFDAYLAGKHGGGLKGAMSGIFFGDPKLISQAAAVTKHTLSLIHI